jgi:photosystem II stability/assembly factor-like uncharacterized protein
MNLPKQGRFECLSHFSEMVMIVAILLMSYSANLPSARAKGIEVIDWASPTLSNLFSIHMVNTVNGWAVGENGTVIHWDGTQWTEVASSTMYVFYSVFMTSADDGWTVGGWGTLIPHDATIVALHWNGTQWTSFGGPKWIALNSVYMVSSDDGWAVGPLGTILRWTGVQWVPEYPETIQLSLTLGLVLIAVVFYKEYVKRAKNVCGKFRA